MIYGEPSINQAEVAASEGTSRAGFGAMGGGFFAATRKSWYKFETGLVQVSSVQVSGSPGQLWLFHLTFKNNYFTEMCSGPEAGSYLRLIDFFITQL